MLLLLSRDGLPWDGLGCCPWLVSTSGCLSTLPALWTLCQALGPLPQRDLWCQWEIFPLPSSLVPLRILAMAASVGGQQQDSWAAWAPRGHVCSLGTLLLAPWHSTQG